MLGKNCIDLIIAFGQNYLQNDLKREIDNRAIDQILLNEKNLAKIMRLNNVDEITYNLENDLNTLLINGNLKLKFLTQKINGLVALGDIVNIAPESIILPQITNFVKGAINKKMHAIFSDLDNKSQKAKLDSSLIKNDLLRNFVSMVLTDSIKLISDKYSNFRYKESESSTKVAFYKTMQNSIDNILGVLDTLVEIVYFSGKIISGQLTVEQTPFLKTWMQDANSLLNGQNIIFTQSNIINQQRIAKLLEAMDLPDDDKVIRTFSQDEKLVLDNYKLWNNDIKLLTIDHLEFLQGRTAICGNSDLGKTSLLKDIKGCSVSPIKGEGTISLPTANSMFLDQHLYIPAKTSLFEAITLKPTSAFVPEEKKKLKEKIISLFKEIAIDKPASEGIEDKGLIASLDDPEYDTTTLSGGQKKKIGIIKAIILEPKLLFADEIFEGLDLDSLRKVKALVKKYLPNSIIIVVEHHINDNLDFYDKIIKLSGDGWHEEAIPRNTSMLSDGDEQPLLGVTPE